MVRILTKAGPDILSTVKSVKRQNELFYSCQFSHFCVLIIISYLLLFCYIFLEFNFKTYGPSSNELFGDPWRDKDPTVVVGQSVEEVCPGPPPRWSTLARCQPRDVVTSPVLFNLLSRRLSPPSVLGSFVARLGLHGGRYHYFINLSIVWLTLMSVRFFAYPSLRRIFCQFVPRFPRSEHKLNLPIIILNFVFILGGGVVTTPVAWKQITQIKVWQGTWSKICEFFNEIPKISGKK